MIANAALSEWLADPARHSDSLAATNSFTQSLARHPLLTGLRDELRKPEARSASDILAIAQRFLARTDEVDGFLASLIGAAARDPYFRPPLPQTTTDVSAGLALFDDPRLWVAAAVTRVDAIAAWKLAKAGPASITFTGSLFAMKFLKAGGATLSFWSAPEADAAFSAERSGRCRFVGRRVIEDGEVLVMDGRTESFVFEHAVSDIVHVQAQIRVDAGPLLVEYDSDTMEFVGVSSTDEASSRTQMMITLLRMMGRADAAPLIEKVLASPHFYTRWHAMREYLALDADAALPFLIRMAGHDPHADVRSAARRTLEAFFPDATQPEPEAIKCRA